jgi:hypothetical protein
MNAGGRTGAALAWVDRLLYKREFHNAPARWAQGI